MVEGEDITPVLAAIRERSGIDFTQYRRGTLQRRIARRVGARQCADLSAYIAILNTDPDEVGNLVRDLTIKYTEFFRDPWVFDVIRDDILTVLAAERAELSVWSAACATGEEAYSIAALIRQMADSEGLPISARVLGTDVDPAALDMAKTGRYNKHVLPRLPEGHATQYFDDDGGTISVSSELKEMVEFRAHDLAKPSSVESLRSIHPEDFDLVLCRNVLIYLQPSAQARVLQLCCDVLAPQGFLILGTGETVPAAMGDRLVPVHPAARIFRKSA